MQSAWIEAELGERLDALRRASTIPLSKAEILAALSDVLAKSAAASAASPDVHGQIRSLAEFVAAARRDMAAEISEARSFEDVTGRHVGKVVAALTEIETRVRALHSLIGHGVAAAAAQEPDGGGSQLADRADERDDFDRRFAGRG